MFLTVDQLVTLLTTLLFLEFFLGVLLIWAIFKLKRMQHNIGDLGQDKYKDLLEWQQETRFALMENYKAELTALTQKAAGAFSDQLEESIDKLQNTTSAGVSEIEQQIKKQAENLAASLNESNKELTAELTSQIEEYKAQKIAAMEKQANGVAAEAAKELIGKQISTAEQHTIVKRLLNEAWEKGNLTNE